MTAMEGVDRAHSHRSGGGGSEFFICFTARLSSSAAAAATRVPSSKSLMSPGRGRDMVAPSLSASLSRRLRSGSLKGAQSPMFPGGAAAPSGTRRKGCAFEAAEPSSPKVTCIGQVRVKSKKKKSKGVQVARSRSQREASFRRASSRGEEERECLPNRNQSWVYQLPLSICEALRAIGSEVNCFVPCRGGRSPCSSSSSLKAGERKVGEVKRSRGTSTCAAVFARWLMAIEEESVEGKRAGEVVDLVEEREKGEVGFLVREREREMKEVENLSAVDLKEEVVVVEEEGRVSVCIPPRNALLLMRCRSDPVRVAAMADRLWGSPAAAKGPCNQDDREEDNDNVGEEEEVDSQYHTEEEEVDAEEIEAQSVKIVCSETGEEAGEKEEVNKQEEEEVAEERPHQGPDVKEEAGISGEEQVFAADDERETAVAEGDKVQDENHDDHQQRDKGKEEGRRSRVKEVGRRRSFSSRDKERRRHSFSSEREARRHSFTSERDARRVSFCSDREGGRRPRWSFSLEKGELTPKDKPTTPSVQTEEEAAIEVISTEEEATEFNIEETQLISAAEDDVGERVVENRGDELPDCLLLMMYEPKLSMEVSKETWVCSTDFHRWCPHHPQRPSGKPTGGGPDPGGDNVVMAPPEKELAVEPSTPVPVPSPMAVATSSPVEKRTAIYGPVVLTRCNSEPVRSSARLAPDACFWKSRHQPMGAAGIGF